MQTRLKVLLPLCMCALLSSACESSKPPASPSAPAVRAPMDTQPLELIATASTNLITNSDFEAGALTGWSTYGAYKYVGTTSSSPQPFKVHGGSYSAQIGSYLGAAGTSYIYQTVAVPTGGATLSFWWYPICYDSVSYDQQWVEIHNTSGALLATVVNDCNNAQTWTQVTYDLTPFAGTSVQLRFGDTDDGYVSTDETYYYLDDVSVTAKSGTNDFSVAVTPSSQSVADGKTVSYNVTTAVTSGSAQTVSLAVSGLPAGVTGSFSPLSVSAGGSSTLTLTASSSAAATTATFTVTGSATSGSHTATASVSVTAATTNDFSLAVSPASQSMTGGTAISYNVTTAVTSGSAQTVNLSVSGLPADVTGSFSPASVSSGGSSTLTLTASSNAAATTATFTVTGSATSGSHTATASVSVTASGGTGVGPNGGSVDHLYFAVVGDTRPGSLDATSSYPTAIITKIYQDINALSPKPQFVVGTGDYMFASTTGGQASTQIGYYKTATQYYTGAMFAAVGNHECDGYTADNCTLGQTDNLNQFMSALVTPLGKSTPYYAININSATAGQWTAKLLIIACNVWDATQKSWLQQQLATPTTYTILARHEPAAATTGPCVNDVETLMTQYPYNLSLVGHTHTFTGSASSKQVIVGTGGAPQTSVPYGFATVERVSTGWQIKQYDYSTNTPVNTFIIP